MQQDQLAHLTRRQPSLRRRGDRVGNIGNRRLKMVRRTRRNSIETTSLSADHDQCNRNDQHDREDNQKDRQELEPDTLGQQFTVIRRVTKQQLRRLRPLEIQVRRVFPREADTAVDLNIFRRRMKVRL